MDETTHTPDNTHDEAPQAEVATTPDLGLQQELQAAHAKAAENLEGWQRAQAEFANYKKRMARDQEGQEAEIRGRVIKRYLEIVDDLELALKNKPAEAEWVQGIELIYRKLLSFLEAEDVQRVDPLGQPFDANLHEAIAQEDSQDYESGTVSEVLRTGYTLGERVLRPAVVKVAK
ncbi:MAG: nucleotide exchange factor GrpE [Anaerolineales bacterium]|nr:nucleotide exchange factor GrpE [Anaerolineales bacterium]